MAFGIDDAELYRARAYALQRLNKFDDALADLNTSLRLAPSDANTFNQRGNLAADGGVIAAHLLRQQTHTDGARCADAHQQREQRARQRDAGGIKQHIVLPRAVEQADEVHHRRGDGVDIMCMMHPLQSF